MTGPVTIDGRRAVRIASADSSTDLLRRRDDLRPDPAGLGSRRREYVPVLARTTGSRRRRTSLKLLDLREAYPDAAVVTGDAQYEQALARLTGGEAPGQSSPQPTPSPSALSMP